MYCPNCGGKIDDDATFCQNCGTKIEQTSVIENIEHFVAEEQESGEIQPIPVKEKSLIDLIKGVNPKGWIGVCSGFLVLLIVVVGICLSNTKKITQNEIDNSNMNHLYDDSDSVSNTETKPIADITEIKISQNKMFYNNISSKFSEDRAWVKYTDPETTKQRVGVIDNYGCLIYTMPEFDSGVDFSGTSMRALDFKDGYSACFSNDHVHSDNISPGFVVVDSAGNECYRSHSTENCGQYLLGMGDGRLIISEHRTSLSNDTWAIFSTDMFGKNKSSEFLSDVSVSCYMDYLGKGLFFGTFIANGYVYNINTNTIISLGDCKIMSFNNGDNLVFSTGGSNYKLYYVDISDLSSQNTFEQWKINREGKIFFHQIPTELFNKNGIYYWGSFFYNYKNGYSNTENPGYYDLYENCKVKFPNFPEGVKILEASKYCNGYGAVKLYGVDSKSYITIIDSSGKQLFDPKRIDSVDLKNFYSGYSIVKIDGKEFLLSPSGTTTEILDNYSDMDLDDKDKKALNVITEGDVLKYEGGFEGGVFKNKYGDVISSIKVVSYSDGNKYKAGSGINN